MNPTFTISLSADPQADGMRLDLELDDITMYAVESRNMPDGAAGCTTTTDLELVAAPPGMCCCCSCCG